MTSRAGSGPRAVGCRTVAYGMEINAEKKLMTNNINGIHKEIKASDHKLQTATNFKYLGDIISDAGFKAEIYPNDKT